MRFAFLLLGSFAGATTGVREVTNSSCDVIAVNLGLGRTTQIVFEQKPKVTLYADQRHFKINTNLASPRSVAIIPFVEASELDAFRASSGRLLPGKDLAQALDKSFRTNLFIFFENSNQLMFDLRFVEREKADNILKVKQDFTKDCVL